MSGKKLVLVEIEMIYPFRKIVFDCKQATLLSIKKAEGKISLVEKWKLSYHLWYCDPCRRFISQWKRFDGLKQMGEEKLLVKPPFQLSETSRIAIQQEIEKWSAEKKGDQ